MRPSRSKPSGWNPGIPCSHGSRPEYEVSRCPLNISVGPPPAPRPRADDVRPAVLDLLPLHSEPELVEDVTHERGGRFLGSREGRRRDESQRELDEAALVDHGLRPDASLTATGTS